MLNFENLRYLPPVDFEQNFGPEITQFYPELNAPMFRLFAMNSIKENNDFCAKWRISWCFLKFDMGEVKN